MTNPRQLLISGGQQTVVAVFLKSGACAQVLFGEFKDAEKMMRLFAVWRRREICVRNGMTLWSPPTAAQDAQREEAKVQDQLLKDMNFSVWRTGVYEVLNGLLGDGGAGERTTTVVDFHEVATMALVILAPGVPQ